MFYIEYANRGNGMEYEVTVTPKFPTWNIRRAADEVKQIYRREAVISEHRACDGFVALVNGGDYRGTYCCTCGEKESAHKVSV